MKIGNKNWSWIRVMRIVSQILFFILLPGLYVSAFGGIKQLYTGIIHLNFSASMLPQLIEVIAVIPVTILLGRFFCGWMCAFGAMSDWLYKLSSKLIKRRFTVPEKADALLKYTKYILLVFLILVVWSFNVTLFGSASPWDAFGMLFTIGKLPDISYVLSSLLPGLIFLILIIAASLFIERFFCRYLCPLGAIFALASKLRITSIAKSRESCGKCRICTKNCPMGIPLYQKDSIKSGECIECLNCVTVCPRHNVSLAVTGKDVRPVIVGTAAVASIAGLYYAGTFTSSVFNTNGIVAQTDASSSVNKLYTDGTYQGQGNGFRGTTTVSVTVKNDKITSIKVLSYKDDDQFFSRASSTIIQSVISKQSTDVNTVSGATYSSRGILSAVENALSKAKIIQGTTALDSSDVTNGTSVSDTGTENSISPTASDSTTTANGASVLTPGSSSLSSSAAANSDSFSPAGSTPENQSVSSSASSRSVTSNSSSNSKASETAGTTKVTTASSKYKDGTYQGSGQGYRGTTTVSVTIQNGVITSVSIVSYKDDPYFFGSAYPAIIQSVINKQSSNVDTVSGATYSSRGIIQAVANALSKAS